LSAAASPIEERTAERKRPIDMRSTAVRALTFATLATVATACGNAVGGPGALDREHLGDQGGTSGRSGDAEGLCVLKVQFRGDDYGGTSVLVAPRHGRILGTGVIPACNDTGEGGGRAERVTIQALPGVSPATAVVVRGWDDSVLVRDDAEVLPAAVQRLTEPVTCRPAGEPITLLGQWTGIIQPNQETELDLVPPYHLYITVRQASHERYDRAFLTVVVPPSLGTPLDRDDVKTSLWKGGDLSAQVHCGSKGTYVADRVEAFPPS